MCALRLNLERPAMLIGEVGLFAMHSGINRRFGSLFNQQFLRVEVVFAFIAFVVRGTRLAENKLMFTIYDYTDATRLFGEDFLTKARKPNEGDSGEPPSNPPIIIQADGFEAEVSDAGRYVVTQDGGQVKRATVEEFKQGLARQLVANTATLDEFRVKWVNPTERCGLLQDLVYSGYSPEIVRQVEGVTDFDLYDVLPEATPRQKVISEILSGVEHVRIGPRARNEPDIQLASVRAF
jgi:hypothetical protein